MCSRPLVKPLIKKKTTTTLSPPHRTVYGVYTVPEGLKGFTGRIKLIYTNGPAHRSTRQRENTYFFPLVDKFRFFLFFSKYVYVKTFITGWMGGRGDV